MLFTFRYTPVPLFTGFASAAFSTVTFIFSFLPFFTGKNDCCILEFPRLFNLFIVNSGPVNLEDSADYVSIGFVKVLLQLN